MDLYNDMTLTSSQTQSIAELLSNTALVQQVVHYDPNNFNHGTFNNGFSNNQNYSTVNTSNVQFHQSTSCPELGVLSGQQIPTNVSTGNEVSNEVPATDNWIGDFNFTVEFNKAQDKTKATPWIVSAFYNASKFHHMTVSLQFSSLPDFRSSLLAWIKLVLLCSAFTRIQVYSALFVFVGRSFTHVLKIVRT